MSDVKYSLLKVTFHLIWRSNLSTNPNVELGNCFIFIVTNTSNKNIGHKIHKQINYKYVQHKRICNGMFWHYRVCINYLFKMPFRVDLTHLCHHKDGNLAKYFPETVVEKIGDVGWNILHQRNLHGHVQDHIPILLLFPILRFDLRSSKLILLSVIRWLQQFHQHHKIRTKLSENQ